MYALLFMLGGFFLLVFAPGLFLVLFSFFLIAFIIYLPFWIFGGGYASTREPPPLKPRDDLPRNQPEYRDAFFTTRRNDQSA